MAKLTGETVQDYLKRFPNTPSLTLAKKIFKENKDLFTSVEHVRSVIRLYRGVAGDKNRKVMSKEFYSQKKHGNNPFELPESDYEEKEPYVFPVAYTNILVLSDIHFPYQDNAALTAALEYGKKEKVNAILLNGDILDMYQASTFEKDPRKRRLSEELEVGRTFLRTLKKKFPRAKVFYKMGNHEERWERMLRVKAPEILDMEEFRLDVVLRFGELGVEEIRDKRIIKIGKLNVIHGHEIKQGISAPVNPARGLYMKTKESSLCGHHHQTSEHTEKNLSGNIVTCWSTGCLSGLKPDYNQEGNKYNHGFAHIKVNKDKTFTVKNLRIINGKIV